ncbi:MAG: hypothetical protein KAQ65_01425 [Candidatus Thorarchaeota archaeon]|nr:hypothetical protein [Candidatus Thorarchaeota archaeon]
MEAGAVVLKNFFVFMCPKCRHFTNAPVGQKRRRCSYCGTIIDITKAARALVDDDKAAVAAVKEYNASRGGDEFHKAVERSRDRIRELVPSKKMTAEDIASSENSEIPTGKRARLLSLLEKYAKDTPLNLTRLEELCTPYQLDWTWVEQQLNTMANGGVLIFPRPWTVKLVRAPDTKDKPKTATRDVSTDILALLRSEGGTLRIHTIMDHFQSIGITSASVEASMEKLMRSGEIYEPKSGYIKVI